MKEVKRANICISKPISKQKGFIKEITSMD